MARVYTRYSEIILYVNGDIKEKVGSEEELEKLRELLKSSKECW